LDAAKGDRQVFNLENVHRLYADLPTPPH